MTMQRRALGAIAMVSVAGCSGGSDAVPAPGLSDVTSTEATTTVAAPPDATVTNPTTFTTIAAETTTTAPASTTTTIAEPTTLPAPSTTEAPPGPFYRAGDEGPEVAVIQLKLATAGFLDSGYTDGVFDSATNSAVLEFQGQYGLIVDGIVGPETERALTAAALSVNPEPG